MKQRLLKYLSWTPYVIASLILVFFLGKNTSALEAHLIDVRNSVRSPLAVGADVPDFTMEDVEGRMLKSSQLPEKCVLVIGDTGCLYFLEAMRSYNAAGNYQGISSLYAVYLGAQNKADRKAVIKATEEFEGIHIFMDYEHSVKWSFRCNEFPTTLVLENGKVVSKEVGYFGQLTGTNENE